LGKLNFLFKIVLSFFLVGFAVWYENLVYNLLLIILLLIILRKEKITLFRFPRQGYFFVLLLFFMFLFQAFNGYGKIMWQLPLGLTLTEQGLTMAAVFVTQVVLIFLTFGVAIYSTDKKQIFYYVKRLERSDKRGMELLQRLARIGMYVLYLLPKSLDYRKHISAELKNKLEGNHASIAMRSHIVLENIYQFIYNILRRSEDEFAGFVEFTNSDIPVKPPAVANFRHIVVTLLVVGLHANLIWNHF
jgi:hypothetical protein